MHSVNHTVVSEKYFGNCVDVQADADVMQFLRAHSTFQACTYYTFCAVVFSEHALMHSRFFYSHTIALGHLIYLFLPVHYRSSAQY